MIVNNFSATVVIRTQEEDIGKVLFLVPGTDPDYSDYPAVYEGEPMIQIYSGDDLAFECAGKNAVIFAEELQKVVNTFVDQVKNYERYWLVPDFPE